MIAFISLQAHSQCVVLKTGSVYAFFRVTNFKEKICWLSEPFAYQIKNNEIASYQQMKECFKKKVTALGGNVDHDVDEFVLRK